MRLLAVLCLLPAATPAADLAFCWQGSGGYVVEGRMTVPDAALNQSRITETDVTAFTIKGFHDGRPIGSWTLDQVTPQTSWTLNFDPAAMEFVVGGFSRSDRGQEWNANGTLDNCGPGGFGFNAGSASQDICIDNRWIFASIVPPDQPLPAWPVETAPPCRTVPVLGRATDAPSRPRS